ncbi:DUF748 domain-containing protein [Microbulbifer spongiae]|uniref:DUF748 domain-containing protein n=1 Tax=Microbulbifer spongiae TaxID=2944933 RepID=A0ABY9EFJ5_9GAMM|nr:DUF748 domain-containing protein [Microbulbifer sp. MI-G]WKD50329.1 DUF748 domain-containing protein [Microbulbifer sp. MI-G]
MPPEFVQKNTFFTRLLWWLIGALLLMEGLSIATSGLVRDKTGQWLARRGLDFHADYVRVSPLNLRVIVVDARAFNSRGQGFSAREVMLDYSWWQLLRGRVQLARASVSGAYLDLQSTQGASGRVWEVGGWNLGRGKPRDRDFHLAIGRAKVQDSKICYRHRPAWAAPTCAQIGNMHARDFRLALWRKGAAPLKVTIAAEEIQLQELLAKIKGAPEFNTTLAHLSLDEGNFHWPSLRTEAESLSVAFFASCPPQQWADALRGLQRLIGHCAAARHLSAEGDLKFGFGLTGLARWHRARGEGVVLRRSDQRWQDWGAGTIAMNAFDYDRSIKRLHWRQAGATDFDWCPRHLRNTNHHYCFRAKTLQLPETTTFDWRHRLKITTGPSRVQQMHYLDMVRPRNNPLTVQQAVFGPLEFDIVSRILAVASLQVDGANGCVSGALWRRPDHCVRLGGLLGDERVAVRFGSTAKNVPWGVASGPLSLAHLRLEGLGEERLQLQKLKWRSFDTLADGTPFSISDFTLQSLSGCLSRGLLPGGWQPLCAELNNLGGRGNFAWQPGADSYAIFGQLQLQRLMLSDSVKGNNGLLLQKLAIGEGYYRRTAVQSPWVGAGQGPGAGQVDFGKEKGRLDAQAEGLDRESEETAPASVDAPNFRLQKHFLQRLDGCLPGSWARLIYRASSAPGRMPVCFDLRELRQEHPLLVAWQDGLDIAVAGLSVERALASTAQGESLLRLSSLALPSARIRHTTSPFGSSYIALPNFSLDGLDACLPATQEVLHLNIHCVVLQQLQLGEKFHVQVEPAQASANLDGSQLAQLQLLGPGDRPNLEIQQLSIPVLALNWSRNGNKVSSVTMEKWSIESLFACLPHRVRYPNQLPRCVLSRNLNAIGTSGVSVGETELKTALRAQPLWQFEALAIERIAFSPDTLDLYNLQIDNILFCGLETLLRQRAGGVPIADCVETPQLAFRGDPIRIGLKPDVARVSLGPVKSRPIAFWQKEGDYLQAGLQQLDWQRFIWKSGVHFSVTGLRIFNTRVCTPESGKTVSIELLERAGPGDTQRCYGLDELAIPSAQTISLSRPFAIDGSLELVGLSLAQRGRAPLRIARVQLENPSVGGEFLFQAGAVSGCLPAGLFRDSPLAPCYRAGPLSLGGVERLDLPEGRGAIFSDIRADGVRLSAADFPRDLPAKLLQVEKLLLGKLRFVSGQIIAQQLHMRKISSCIPYSYFKTGNHCITLGTLALEGQFAAEDGLAITVLNIHGIELFSRKGKLLAEGESLHLSRFLANRREWRFEWLEAVHFHFFPREETTPDYDRHSWTGDFRFLQIEALQFDRLRGLLNIASVDFFRPRLILLRNRYGAFPLVQQISELRGLDGGDKIHLRNQTTPPFLYHIHDVYLRHGTFTWIDYRDEFRARLPVRDINLNVSDISNLGEHPPAIVVANGRPGGFGEIQLSGTVDYLGGRRWDAQLTSYLDNVNLIPATPYMARLLGYKILQGQMDAVMDIRIRDNQINALAEIKLEKIKIRRVRDDDQLPVKSRFIPLNVALWLLKDGQGNVKFSMPVTGDIRDPKFSLNYVFSDVLQKAIMDALFSYFTPYGIYLLAKLAWGRFRAKSFDSIEFAPGSAHLSNVALAQLQQMVVKLHKHPEARPGICGIANARDWNALYPNSTLGLNGNRSRLADFYRYPPIMLREEFERLAQERSRQVERYLIDAGIPAAELIPCAPDYMGRDFGDPRVEFSN